MDVVTIGQVVGGIVGGAMRSVSDSAHGTGECFLGNKISERVVITFSIGRDRVTAHGGRE